MSRLHTTAVTPLVVENVMHERVALPRTRRSAIGVAAPQVDDDSPSTRRRARRADVAVLGEVARERVGHAPEAVVDVAVHRGHRGSPLASTWPQPCNRASVASASAMIRSISSATVGSSSITPTTCPVGRIPTSASPSTIVAFVSIGAFAASATWLHGRPWLLVHRLALGEQVT